MDDDFADCVDPPDPDLEAVDGWFERHQPEHFAMWRREGDVIIVTLAGESRGLAQPLRDEFGELVRVEVADEGASIELQ